MKRNIRKLAFLSLCTAALPLQAQDISNRIVASDTILTTTGINLGSADKAASTWEVPTK